MRVDARLRGATDCGIICNWPLVIDRGLNILDVRRMKKIRWGVLSTAKIGREKVIPATQLSETGVVTAIASRDLPRAKAAAEQLGIEKAYGSYEELLADPDIDAIYNPL